MTQTAARRLFLAICSYMAAQVKPSGGPEPWDRRGRGSRGPLEGGPFGRAREAHLWYFALGLVGLEEGDCVEPERARQQVPGEALQSNVVVPATGVVETTGVFELVFSGSELLLQLEEALDGT